MWAVRVAVTAVAALAAAVLAATGLAASAPTAFHTLDSRLCPFDLEVRGTPEGVAVAAPVTGRTAVVRAEGSWQAIGGGERRFVGEHLWLSAKNHVPYLLTTGAGRLSADGVLLGGGFRARVVDPCALVAKPATVLSTGPAPWPVPQFALSRIAAAGLTPLIGPPTRHDHLHLDVLVNGRPVTVPAGIGQAEPVDRGPGPCPPPPDSRTIGDCAPGHYFTSEVAASQLQTHSASGIVHLQAERPDVLRLGQFFDEWGVRLDRHCLGGYCAGGGRELRVYVNGRRLPGDPRRLVLRDGIEIAVVYGGPRAFRSVPSRYGKRMPAGCGGPGEPTCFPG
jgi:hypothetical protein